MIWGTFWIARILWQWLQRFHVLPIFSILDCRENYYHQEWMVLKLITKPLPIVPGSVFALLDIEIEACRCNNPLLVNGTDPLNQPLWMLEITESDNVMDWTLLHLKIFAKPFPNIMWLSISVSSLAELWFLLRLRSCSIMDNSCAVRRSTQTVQKLLMLYLGLGFRKTCWEICMATTYGPNWQTLYPNCHWSSGFHMA